jgi:hypothetical protein
MHRSSARVPNRDLAQASRVPSPHPPSQREGGWGEGWHDTATAFLLTTLACLGLLLATLLVPLPALAQHAALETELDRIARETAAIRELPPLDEVDDVLLTRDELLAMMPELIAEEVDPAAIAAQARGLAALGLIPTGTDLVDLGVRLLGEQAYGYYDPITDEMIVVTDGGADLGVEEYFYSHEIVHALQDAHLDPEDLMEAPTSGNGDADLALLALYEGDATIASTLYLESHPELALELIGVATNDAPEVAAAPGAMVVSLFFPYIEGPRFVERLLREGGWDAVNAAHAAVPVSTEQILHPGKYLKRDLPVAVALPDPADALGSGWTLVDDDTLGELQIGLMLADLDPGEGINTVTGAIAIPEAARNAAAGWDGDRYALWESGDAEVLVWRSVWDTESDARAFSRALAQFGNNRWGGVFNGESPDDVALATPEIAARIELDGQEVRYVQAPTLALADAALAALQAAPPPDPAPGPE